MKHATEVTVSAKATSKSERNRQATDRVVQKTSGSGPGGYVRNGHHVVVGNKKPLSESFNSSRRSKVERSR